MTFALRLNNPKPGLVDLDSGPADLERERAGEEFLALVEETELAVVESSSSRLLSSRIVRLGDGDLDTGIQDLRENDENVLDLSLSSSSVATVLTAEVRNRAFCDSLLSSKIAFFSGEPLTLDINALDTWTRDFLRVFLSAFVLSSFPATSGRPVHFVISVPSSTVVIESDITSFGISTEQSLDSCMLWWIDDTSKSGNEEKLAALGSSAIFVRGGGRLEEVDNVDNVDEDRDRVKKLFESEKKGIVIV